MGPGAPNEAWGRFNIPAAVVCLTVVSGPWRWLACPDSQLPPPPGAAAPSSHPAMYFKIPGGGILPAGSGGMQATRRPNEVVSQRRIIVPRLIYSRLRLHSQASAGLRLCDWLSVHDFISGLPSRDRCGSRIPIRWNRLSSGFQRLGRVKYALL